MKPRTQPNTTESAIQAAIEAGEKAYEEALDDLTRSKHPHPELSQAPREAWRKSLPALTSRTNIQAFIACVAVGMARQRIATDQAKALLYTAQLSLAAISGGNNASHNE